MISNVVPQTTKLTKLCKWLKWGSVETFQSGKRTCVKQP